MTISMRMKISDKYLAECVIIHRSLDDAFPRVEVTKQGYVAACGVADDWLSGWDLETFALDTGTRGENWGSNAQAINAATALAKEYNLIVLFREG